MYKDIINSKVNQKPALFLVAIVFFSLFAVICLNVQAAYPVQDDLRKTVYGPVQPKPQPSRQPNNQNNQKIKKPRFVAPEKPAVPKKPVVVKKSLPARPRPALLNVTFTAQQPNLEIWLNDKNIGLTDKNAKFTKRLAPNIYRVAVKKGDQIVFPVKAINVSAEQTEFKLFNEMAAVQKTPDVKPQIPLKEEKTKSEDEVAEETAVKIRQILEDYADPSKTDMVGTEDWELVFQSAQVGQLQGFTAVQIEAQRWFASGQIELARQDYTSAYTAFTKAVEYMPKSALPFYGMGKAYIADNQPAQALRAFQKAVQLEPKMAMLYKGVGDAQRLLKNKKEAIVAYKNAVQLGYTTPEMRRLLGEMLLETERTKEALGELEELAKSAPTAELYVAIGDGYQKLKREFSAIEFYQKAIDIDPNLAVAYFKLGDSLLNQREYSKAKEAFEKAVELDPDGKTFNRAEARKKAREATSKIK